MKKIRITEPGWDGFTGNYGGVEFVNGESVDLVSPFNATRLAGLIRIEDSDGKNPSMSQLIAETMTLPASEDMTSKISTGVSNGEATPAKITGGYTRKQLGEIVDKGGIKALREIAGPLGARGTKVADLIEKIIQAQGGEPQEAEQEEAPEQGAQDGEAASTETTSTEAVDPPEDQADPDNAAGEA